MSQLERQQKILSILGKKGSISIRELSGIFYASESSIRRDIASLEQRGLVTHIYGGVMLTDNRNAVTPLDIRNSENKGAKDVIAARAAEMVKSGDTILLDSSSTVRRMIKYLGGKRDIRIITNNSIIFSDYTDVGATLYCTGGTYNPKNHNFLGPAAEAYVRKVSADIVFFSSQGISEDGVISDVSEEETSLRSVMISRARKKVFLCDSSKIGVTRLFSLCTVADVSEVICDKPELMDEIVRRCKENR